MFSSLGIKSQTFYQTTINKFLTPRYLGNYLTPATESTRRQVGIFLINYSVIAHKNFLCLCKNKSNIFNSLNIKPLYQMAISEIYYLATKSIFVHTHLNSGVMFTVVHIFKSFPYRFSGANPKQLNFRLLSVRHRSRYCTRIQYFLIQNLQARVTYLLMSLRGIP